MSLPVWAQFCSLTNMNPPSRLVLGIAVVVLASGCAAEAGESDESPASQAAALEVNARTASPEAFPARARGEISWNVQSPGLDALVGPGGFAQPGALPTLEVLREPLLVSGRSEDFATESKRLPR